MLDASTFSHWTPRGLLWFGTELSRAVITTGSLALHSFVAELVQGEWQADLPGGGSVDRVICKDGFIWSFRRSLALLATEPGDFLVLEFNLKERKIALQAGGPDLLEAMQEGADASDEIEALELNT